MELFNTFEHITVVYFQEKGVIGGMPVFYRNQELLLTSCRVKLECQYLWTEYRSKIGFLKWSL